MTPIVLIHGGGCSARCWELLTPHLDSPAIAVDLPGRGAHPTPLESVTLHSCAESIVADVDAAGFDEVVLVGHSLAGCSIPFAAELLGARTRHIVFVAATVPPHGMSAFDTLDAEIQELIHAMGPTTVTGVLDGELAKIVLGADLTDEQLAWCTERLVPEAMRLTTDPVSHTGLTGIPSTWVRTTGDLIVAPEKQAQFATNISGCDIVDFDAGHMCMVSKPAELALLLDGIAPRG